MSTAKERHPEVYRVGNDDPRKRVRTVPMQVLSMGYSRTGTMCKCALGATFAPLAAWQIIEAECKRRCRLSLSASAAAHARSKRAKWRKLTYIKALKTAYEILGIPSSHWMTMAENPPDILMWAEALESKFDPKKQNPLPLDRNTFDMLLGNKGACTDQPAAIFAKELVAAYPEAKVVLVERDVDKWYRSFQTVIDGADNPVVPFVTKIDRTFMGPMARVLDLATRNVFHVNRPRETWCMNDPKHFEEWRQNAKAAYIAHNEEVKRVTPPERLLVFKLEHGWEPLCEFLGLPVPEVDFPKINDTEALKELLACYIAEGMRRGLVDIAKKATPVAVLGLSVAAWYFWR